MQVSPSDDYTRTRQLNKGVPRKTVQGTSTHQYHQKTDAAIVALLSNLLCKLLQAGVLQQVMLSVWLEAYSVGRLQTHLKQPYGMHEFM